MRIAVFGTGGAGGYFGAHLAHAGEDVVFVARGEHLRAIQVNGLRIEKRSHIEPSKNEVSAPETIAQRTKEKDTSGGESSDEGFVVRTNATDDPKQIGEVDVVLVGVKAWQVEDAARAMRPMIGADTVVVPLQNGVDAAAMLASVVGIEHVLNGLCGTISRVVAPGHILSIGETNFIKFGEFDNKRSDRGERLRAAFERASVRAEVPADIEAAVWEKFIFVTPYGGVGAVGSVFGVEGGGKTASAVVGEGLEYLEGPEYLKSAGGTPTVLRAGSVRSIPETREMVREGMEEILAVARARHINLADGIFEKTMALLDSLDPNATTSLQRDILAGKPSELEAWTGAVVRLGKESGVPTPVNENIYQKLLPLELKARGLQ